MSSTSNSKAPDVLAWDTETCPITEFCIAPELVCVSLDTGELFEASEGLARMVEALKSDGCLVGHNTAFDWAVLCTRRRGLVPYCFDAYRAGRIRDTQLREQILDAAKGELGDRRYSLKDIVKRRLRISLDKTRWRMGYESLKDTPFEQWPQGAKDYAIKDAVVTRQIYEDQGRVEGEREHALGAWMFHLMFHDELRYGLLSLTVCSKNAYRLDKLREQLLSKNIYSDVNGNMPKKFAQIVFKVRGNVGREVLRWGSWHR